MVEVTAHLATARTSSEPLCAAPNLLAWREVIFTLNDTPSYVVIYMSLCGHYWPICSRYLNHVDFRSWGHWFKKVFKKSKLPSRSSTMQFSQKSLFENFCIVHRSRQSTLGFFFRFWFELIQTLFVTHTKNFSPSLLPTPSHLRKVWVFSYRICFPIHSVLYIKSLTIHAFAKLHSDEFQIIFRVNQISTGP